MPDAAFLTSGSTGKAKEILRLGREMEADARALAAKFFDGGRGAARCVAGTVPLDHFYGTLWRSVLPGVAGLERVPETFSSVESLAGGLSGRDGIVLVTTPSFLGKALEHPLAASLRGRVAEVVTSGSTLPAETAAAAERVLGVRPLEIFGSTETGTVAWRRGGVEWTQMDGVEASADGEGCLVVDSPWAMERPMAMSDAVRFTAPRRFVLLGRTDRIAKILETIVPLEPVERAFLGHPFVSSCRAAAWGDAPKRIGLLAVLSREGLEALAAGTHSGTCSRLRADLLGKTGALAFPRRIRFVRELPVDARGKIPEAAVAAALGDWCQEPAVLEWKAAADSLDATLVFPPDCRCFSGHFPSVAVLPGVAQLFFLRRFAKQAFPDFPDAGTFVRLKFRKLVFPGVELSLRVRRGTGDSFAFSMECPDGPCLSGVVEKPAR